MWKSTEKMAHAILEGAIERGVDARLINIRTSGTTVLAAETLDAAAIAFGSPTLNMTLMPQMAAGLTYLKGLKPAGKSGFAFGSYGWAKGGAMDVETYLKDMKFEILREPLQCQFVPGEEILDECRAAGRMLADKALAVAGGEKK
jgi:flavorubredoxin